MSEADGEENKERIGNGLELYDIKLTIHNPDEVVRVTDDFFALKKDFPNGPIHIRDYRTLPHIRHVIKVGDRYVSMDELPFEGGPRYVETQLGEHDSAIAVMETIHKMFDRKTGRTVVAKHNYSYSTSLLAEAQHLARFQHPNIAVIYDMALRHGRLADPESLYFIMEYLGGNTLHDWSSKASTIAECAHIFDQIASAMTYIHDQGYIHGDLHSENIIFNENGIPKIIDIETCKKIGIVYHGHDSNETFTYSPADDERKFALLVFEILYPKASKDLFENRTLQPLEPAEWLQATAMIHPDFLERINAILLKSTDPEREKRLGSIEELNRQIQEVLQSVKL